MKKQPFKFIDLFAGIGGIRLGFESAGFSCVFSSEWDKFACQTYNANFGDMPYGDITKIEATDIPNFDVLCAGFPCQPFSNAGKKLGFDDTRGTLFFDIVRITKHHLPKVIFLENVKGLVTHDKGNTFKVILQTLHDLGYSVSFKILNAKDFGVPQNRERIYIVAFLGLTHNFNFPIPSCKYTSIKDILEKTEVSSKYYLSQVYLETLKRHKARHESKNNGFGYIILQDSSIANTLVVGGMGRERNLIIDTKLTDFTPKTRIHGSINNEYIRKLTPRECARLQGFSDNFTIPVSDAQAFKQFGNSVCVPVISNIAKNIHLSLLNEDSKNIYNISDSIHSYLTVSNNKSISHTPDLFTNKL